MSITFFLQIKYKNEVTYICMGFTTCNLPLQAFILLESHENPQSKVGIVPGLQTKKCGLKASEEIRRKPLRGIHVRPGRKSCDFL